jgi:hypothetical protein
VSNIITNKQRSNKNNQNNKTRAKNSVTSKQKQQQWC